MFVSLILGMGHPRPIPNYSITLLARRLRILTGSLGRAAQSSGAHVRVLFRHHADLTPPVALAAFAAARWRRCRA
jgi:TRAP-type uncharacterized transport system fused permease subunit